MRREVDMKPVWAAMVSTDERGGDIVYGWYSTKEYALTESRGKGWYGSHGHAVQHKAVVIDGTTYLLGNAGHPIDVDGEQAIQDAELRKTTLASLTDEQLRVLGLKRDSK